jgi:hypothetical protein
MRRSRRLLLLIFSFLFLFILMIKYRSRQVKLIKSKPRCIQLTTKNKMFDNFQMFEESSHTLCSERATKHGLHQRVIGISAYRSNEDNIHLSDKIVSYTLEYLSEAEHFYPDWRVRVCYHNLDLTMNDILSIEKRYKNVDFCDVFNIPLLGNLSSYMFGRLHRFVDIYMSRDIDSPILTREVVSVNEWILSNKLFHIMRDHPYHFNVILAGLWAFKVSNNKTITNQITRRLFSKSLINCYDSMSGNQDFLEDFVWPIAEKESIQHDSFHCQQFIFSIPFSTPKLSLTQFVGCRRPCRHDQDSPEPCPTRCRSPNHTDQYLC